MTLPELRLSEKDREQAAAWVSVGWDDYIDRLESDALAAHAYKVACETLEAEVERLRAALAQSELPCIYCTLPKEDWHKCRHGFPGCSRGDDAMGCPELGASMRAEAAEARNAALVKVLEEAAGRLHWAAMANPGVSCAEGKALVLSWAEDARTALGDA